jgi:hypothetical protein
MSEAIIGLIGVIVGSTITVAKDFIGTLVEQRRNARYAAIRIICILEEYAQKCVAVVSDDGTSYGRPAGRTSSNEEYYDPQIESPNPPIYPEDINWKNFSKKLLYRILMLPNTARETNQYISNSAEHSGPPDYEEMFEARQEGYANLALQALALAGELRREYGLPETTVKLLNPDWNPKQYLEDKKKEIDAQKNRRAVAAQALWKSLESREATSK